MAHNRALTANPKGQRHRKMNHYQKVDVINRMTGTSRQRTKTKGCRRIKEAAWCLTCNRLRARTTKLVTSRNGARAQVHATMAAKSKLLLIKLQSGRKQTEPWRLKASK